MRYLVKYRHIIRQHFNIPPLLFLYLVFLGSITLLSQWFSFIFFQEQHTISAIIAHIIPPALCIFLLPYQQSRTLVHNLLLLLCLASFFLSFIGTLGWFLTLSLSCIWLSPSNALQEYCDYLSLKVTHEEILKNLVFGQERQKEHFTRGKGELAPYVEILQGSDIDLKLSVIEKLSLAPDPNKVAMLKIALQDRDSEVQFSAATGLRKIEDRFNVALMGLKQECKLKPSNDQIFSELGTTYDNYAYCKVLDAKTARHYQDLAIEHYQKSLSINPFEEGYYKNLGRLLIRVNRISEAISVLEEGLKLNPNSLVIKTWLIEYYFKQKSFTKVREMAENIPTDQLNNPRIKQAISWWHI